LRVELDGRAARQGEGDFDFTVDQARVAGRDQWAQLRGSGTVRGLQVDASDPPDLRWARMELDLAELRGTIADKAIAAGGTLALEKGRWSGGELTLGRLATDGLELRVGDNHGWLLADLRKPAGGLSGQFHLLAESLDDKDLADWIAAVRRMGRVEPPTTSTAPAPGRDARLAEADRRIDAARQALAPVALEGRISIDRFRTYDAELDRSYLARSVEARVAIDGPRLSGNLDAAVYGGMVSRAYALDLSEPAPRLAVRSGIRELIPNETIQPQLTWNFPGNTISGLFSRAEDLAIPLHQLVAHGMDPSVPVWPVGHAKTIAVKGMLQGRAAPSFVAGIFPGLNLTRYRYDRMTAFAQYQPDGTAVNDMVFSGQTYDIYIEGTTDADHMGRYEIGLILLGTPQSAEWNHTYRQGRIPLLNVKARIEGGRMIDESVSYPYPTQSLFAIFLKNNIFYRLWLASKR
jgi:hypothetical protein